MSSLFDVLPAVGMTSHITARCALMDRHSPPVSLETCTPQDPSYRYSVDDILRVILKSRKSWKTLKGRSEAVWPPYLEATMLKALQEYEPDDSRETRMLGRHPMRNRFISDYIHNATGKYRSAKQVGSRLQQLRDSAEGRELIDVLTHCYHTRMDAGNRDARIPVRQSTPSDSSSSPPFSTISSGSSSSSSFSSPATQTNSVMPRIPPPQSRQPTEPRMPVYIDILPQQSTWSSMSRDPSSSASAPPMSNSDSRASDAARPIRNIDPTVTFVSPSRVHGKSSYIVLLDGAPVHSEDTALEYAGPYFSSSTAQSPDDGPVLYNTALVPKYWDVLCEAPDPTLYTIIQDVYHMPNPAPNQGFSQRPRPVRIFSAAYSFRYPSSADSTLSYGQSPVEMSSGGSSVTSAFRNQTAQGSMPVDPTSTSRAQATSFPAYAASTSEELRTPTGVDQNLFDEPFMLDVNFDQIAFDELFVNMDNASDRAFSPHFLPRDPSGFM